VRALTGTVGRYGMLELCKTAPTSDRVGCDQTVLAAEAIVDGDVDAVASLAPADPRLDEVDPTTGMTPLMLANGAPALRDR
jgi:hypothetical protein